MTLLAGANIEILTILESKIQIFGLNFNTGFSPPSLKVIKWGTWFNLLAEDIPQIIIQVHNFLHCFTLILNFHSINHSFIYFFNRVGI